MSDIDSEGISHTDPRPVMTRREASFHETIAGLRAVEAARAAGGDPLATEALLGGAAGEVDIDGWKFKRPPAAMEQIAARASKVLEGAPEADRIIAGTFNYFDPKRAFQLLTAPNGPEAYFQAVAEFAFELPYDVLIKANQHIDRWAAELNLGRRAVEDHAKKPDAAAEPSNGSPPMPVTTPAAAPVG